MADAWYVLLEKSISDGSYRTVDISRHRQSITNDRQERLALTNDLKRVAPDYTDYSFETYTDEENYINPNTVVMRCGSAPRKAERYGPCNSDFGALFIPMGVQKLAAAGRMRTEVYKSWENPHTNRFRYVTSPIGALQSSGALKQLADLTKTSSPSDDEPHPPQTAAATPTNTLEVNNHWSVIISNSTDLNAPLYVTLKQVGNYWEIDGLFDTPQKLPRSRKLELFMATRDFQKWTNYYVDMRTDCEKFEVKEDNFHSVCTSSLAENKTMMATAKLLFGGSGKVPFAYTDSKVKAAINSIRPQQAQEMLTKYETGALSAQKGSK